MSNDIKNLPFLKLAIVWVLFIPVAIINGAVRNFVYAPYTGELFAHQISTVIAIIVFISLAFLILAREFISLNRKMLLVSGSVWVFSTILFEFGFGHFIMGHPWSRLLMDYDFTKGRVWGLFLLAMFFSPFIINKLARKKEYGKN